MRHARSLFGAPADEQDGGRSRLVPNRPGQAVCRIAESLASRHENSAPGPGTIGGQSTVPAAQDPSNSTLDSHCGLAIGACSNTALMGQTRSARQRVLGPRAYLVHDGSLRQSLRQSLGKPRGLTDPLSNETTRSGKLAYLVPLGPQHQLGFPTLEDQLTVSEGTDLSDLQLVEGLVLGQEAALAEIFRRHARSVAATARMILGNSSACDDVVAEVFLALWLKPETFDSRRGSLRGFLRLKARGRSIDIVRSDVARRRREMSDERAHGRYTTETEEEFLSSEAAEQMQKAVARLDDREREPIELAFFTGLSYKDVAKHLALPEGTVKSRIRSGLHHVRVAFESQLLIEAEADGSVPPSDRGGK